MRVLGAIILCLAACGCTTPAIPMLDPASGQRTDCGSHLRLWLANEAFLPGEEMACQAEHEARGWVRAPLRF